MSVALLPLSGYASLFGVADLSGDVVHAGAFARSLQATPRIPMLVEHQSRLLAGEWRTCIEDSRGLFVEGVILSSCAAASLALRRIASGLDGLSIGFSLVSGNRRPGGGRDIWEVTLFEISLVRKPMLPQARLHRPALGLSST